MPFPPPDARVDALVRAELGDAERLAIAYAPARRRPAYCSLLALDAVLRRAALGGREPLPAQLKLAWWRDACSRLPEARDHPVLAALAESWPGDAGALVALVDAWEEVAVAEGGFAAAVEAVAGQRGTALALCADESETRDRDVARVWTLVTLADRAPDAAARAGMRAAASLIPRFHLNRAMRPLAVLDGLARRALAADRALLIGDRWSPLVAMRLGIFGR
jgi:phytoene synthase